MGTLVIIISIIVGVVLSAFLIKIAITRLGGLIVQLGLTLIGLGVAFFYAISNFR